MEYVKIYGKSKDRNCFAYSDSNYKNLKGKPVKKQGRKAKGLSLCYQV